MEAAMRFLPLIAVLSAAFIASGASAYTLKSLYSFCPGGGCLDGVEPMGGLVADASGNLYGVTNRGGNGKGTTAGGTVFELGPNGDGTWTHQVLHNFCGKANCVDGQTPLSGLIIGTDGTLYGTTLGGGTHSNGVVFKLVPNAGHTAWRETVLYNFCSLSACADGTEPSGVLAYQGAASGVPYDGTSPLYATTQLGGTHDQGVVFRLAPDARGRFSETVLYDFCPNTGSPDGQSPRTGVVIDGAGALYGVTYSGGANSQGTLFKLTNTGGDTWSESVLASFCNERHCADGQQPSAAPVIDGTGALYGATMLGGNRSKGLLYAYASGSLSTLYAFCPGASCSDGALPESPLIVDPSGNLFGTTSQGVNGDKNTPHGKAFEWNGSYQVIYDFCTVGPNCADGDLPSSPLLMDSSGNLFGETLQGGTSPITNGGGTVYELMP
jgi:uncharacterized repeat protein (TIGR03803 family)